MSVTNTTNLAAEAGNGVKVAFDFAFKIFAKTDLIVYKETAPAVYALQILDTDYSVVFDPIAETGTITYATAPGAGLDSVILRAVGQTQGSSFPRENPMPEKAIEDALDKLTLVVQDLQERMNRAPLLPVVPPTPERTEIVQRVDLRLLKWSYNAGEGRWEIVSSSVDPDVGFGSVVQSGLAAGRPASPTSPLLYYYSTDTDQLDLWILDANKWFLVG